MRKFIAALAVLSAGAALAPMGWTETLGELVGVRVLRDVTGTAMTRRFKELEREGLDLKVLSCQFNKLSPDVVTVELRRAPDARPTVLTESLVGSQYESRVNELVKAGWDVRTVCFENLPYWLGDHAVVQFRRR